MRAAAFILAGSLVALGGACTDNNTDSPRATADQPASTHEADRAGSATATPRDTGSLPEGSRATTTGATPANSGSTDPQAGPAINDGPGNGNIAKPANTAQGRAGARPGLRSRTSTVSPPAPGAMDGRTSPETGGTPGTRPPANPDQGANATDTNK